MVLIVKKVDNDLLFELVDVFQVFLSLLLICTAICFLYMLFYLQYSNHNRIKIFLFETREITWEVEARRKGGKDR